MGTYHDHKGELHGITVVVDTHGSHVFVGRCDTVTPQGVILLDVDVHDEAAGGATKAEYVAKAAKVGTWKKYERVVVPSQDVASIRKLGDVARAT